MTQELSHIIQDIVSQMDCTTEGVFNSDLGHTDTCKTKWARKGKTVLDSDGNVFKIEDVSTDEFILASNKDSINLNGTIYLNQPVFIHGTKLATNLEWTKMSNNVLSKTPIIWLLGSLNFKQYGRESVLDIESAVRIFFLDETDVVNFKTNDHIENVVYPMEAMAEEFISTINKNRQFKTVESWEIIEFTRFGVEQENGYFQNILDANLSGVELRITLTKYKQNCKC